MGSNPSKVTRCMGSTAPKRENGPSLEGKSVYRKRIIKIVIIWHVPDLVKETVPADTSSGGAQEYRGY